MKKFLMFLIIAVMVFTVGYADDEFLSVCDNGNMLSPSTEKYIYTLNKALSDKTGARVIVATDKSTGELSVPEYARKLYDELGVAQIGRKNCVFLFLCQTADDYHVIVSNGINASLTDRKAQNILIECLENSFSVGKYDDAAIKTFNGFAQWFCDKYGIELDLTEDMREYDNIIRTETNRRTLKTVLIVLLAVAVAGSLGGYVVYSRRKKRMEKLRKKRQERRKRYMQIK